MEIHFKQMSSKKGSKAHLVFDFGHGEIANRTLCGLFVDNMTDSPDGADICQRCAKLQSDRDVKIHYLARLADVLMSEVGWWPGWTVKKTLEHAREEYFWYRRWKDEHDRKR